MRRDNAFTLVELLVSMAVLLIIVLFVSALVNSATNIETLDYKRMDADGQIRPVFNRMAIDFSQMIKRSDVDYYVKASDAEIGNDRIAFFCNAPGYYPSSGSNSPISLVAYRVNSDRSSPNFNKMERMGKGLLWSGSSTPTAMLFGLQTIYNYWPAATDPSSPDEDYELVGAQIFRFEYFYLLNDGSTSVQPGNQGMQQVSAIAVALATIDVKSRALLSDSQITTLIGRLKDFDLSKSNDGGDLVASWQSTLNGVTDMPRTALAGIRIHQRYFPLK